VHTVMARAKRGEKRANSADVTVGHETQLWQMADGISGAAEASNPTAVLVTPGAA